MTAIKTKFTRFERTMTSIIGYQEIEGVEQEAIKIVASPVLNGTISITASAEIVDDLIDFVNSKL